MVGKLFVPAGAHTPGDRVREALDEAELRVTDLRGADRHQLLALLHLLDQIAADLATLEETGADVRAERTRFETIQLQLRHRKRRFLSEVGAALREERASLQPDRARWWWYLDEIAAGQRRQRLLRIVIGTVAVVALLAVGWLAYERFVAPPPSVRQAVEHTYTGKAQVREGDLRAALGEFEAATALNPDDLEPWLWEGVLHAELDERDEAQAAFDAARALYGTDFDFFLGRGRIYLEVRDSEAAGVDAERAIAENPKSGWGYYLRAGVAVQREDYRAALKDLERAADLAQEAGETRLQTLAVTQRAKLLQMEPHLATPTP